MAEFKKGDKFIIELGECDPERSEWWRVEGCNGLVVTRQALKSLKRYVPSLEGAAEIPGWLREVLYSRADELLEQVKVLEKERDKIMDFLHSAKRSHEK